MMASLRAAASIMIFRSEVKHSEFKTSNPVLASITKKCLHMLACHFHRFKSKPGSKTSAITARMKSPCSNASAAILSSADIEHLTTLLIFILCASRMATSAGFSMIFGFASIHTRPPWLHALGCAAKAASLADKTTISSSSHPNLRTMICWLILDFFTSLLTSSMTSRLPKAANCWQWETP